MQLQCWTLLAFISGIFALPHLDLRQLQILQTLPKNLPLSADEGNSGPFPSLTFDAADQYVDVRPGTEHEWRPPGPGDKRGPCPGLNAAANSGFLDRSGINTIEQTVTGLSEAYSFGTEFAAVLAVVAILLTGDPIAGTWSIGQPYNGVLDGLLSEPEGLSFSHNTYESDASPGRSDTYLNNGDASSLNLSRFDQLYFSAESYTLDILRDHNKAVHDFSIQNNPYFFAAPFAGLVPPIAHHFIVNLMSNHSSSNPEGYLDRSTLKSFFSVSGPDDAHVWTYGHEAIPQGWYKRPSSNPYGTVAAVADVLILATKYPEIVEVGGNTGTTNSFTGVNLGDLTGGAFNASTLLEGNNLGCFIFQAAQQAIPSVLKGLVGDLTSILGQLTQILEPILDDLACPGLGAWDTTSLEKFPGAGYHPTG